MKISLFKLKKKHIQFYLLLLIFTVIGIILFPLNGVRTTPDSAWYLSNALNIYKGYGYVDVNKVPILNRGFLFPFLINISFYIFGVSIEHAFWVVRLFFIFNILLIYIFGKTLLNDLTGIFAALFYITSYVIHDVSSRMHLDSILPFFILLFIMFIKLAFEKEKYSYFILAGVILGLSFLIKELTVIFIPLPLLIYIFYSQYHKKRLLSGIGLVYIIFLLIILPWAIYIYKVSGNFNMILGRVIARESPRAIRALSGFKAEQSFSLVVMMMNSLKALINYSIQYISHYFILTPLFFLSAIFTIYKGFYKKKLGSLVIALSILLFIPVSIYISNRELRLGQSMVLYLLLYIITADFIFEIGLYLLKKLSDHRIEFKWLKKNGLIIIFSILVFIQVIGEKKIINVWQGQGINGINYFHRNAFTLTGWHNPDIQKAGRWLQKNISKNENILCDWFCRRSLYYFSDAKYTIYTMPYLSFLKRVDWQPYRKADNKSKVLFIWPNLNNPKAHNYLKLFLEEPLLSCIQQNRIQYIIVTYRRNFISLYFDENPGFRKVAEFSMGKIKIYQVRKPGKLNQFHTKIGTNLPKFLKNLKNRKPEEYTLLTEKYFRNYLGISEKDISKIVRGQLSSIETYTVY